MSDSRIFELRRINFTHLTNILKEYLHINSDIELIKIYFNKRYLKLHSTKLMLENFDAPDNFISRYKSNTYNLGNGTIAKIENILGSPILFNSDTRAALNISRDFILIPKNYFDIDFDHPSNNDLVCQSRKFYAEKLLLLINENKHPLLNDLTSTAIVLLQRVTQDQPLNNHDIQQLRALELDLKLCPRYLDIDPAHNCGNAKYETYSIDFFKNSTAYVSDKNHLQYIQNYYSFMQDFVEFNEKDHQIWQKAQSRFKAKLRQLKPTEGMPETPADNKFHETIIQTNSVSSTQEVRCLNSINNEPLILSKWVCVHNNIQLEQLLAYCVTDIAMLPNYNINDMLLVQPINNENTVILDSHCYIVKYNNNYYLRRAIKSESQIVFKPDIRRESALALSPMIGSNPSFFDIDDSMSYAVIGLVVFKMGRV